MHVGCMCGLVNSRAQCTTSPTSINNDSQTNQLKLCNDNMENVLDEKKYVAVVVVVMVVMRSFSVFVFFVVVVCLWGCCDNESENGCVCVCVL